MHYLITYNYNGEIKEVATMCADYESLVETILKETSFFFPSFCACGICMQDFTIMGEGGEITFSYRTIDRLVIR